MKIWHVVKSEKLLNKMLADGFIKLGRNIMGSRHAHVTIKEPISGYDLDVIGCNTRGRPVYQVLMEIDRATELYPDPSGDDPDWYVSDEPIKILNILDIRETVNPIDDY